MNHDEIKSGASAWAREMLQNGLERVVILDTETCDLHGEVIELAIIDIEGNVLYNQRFDPLTEIEPGAQAVHGITREMLAEAPRWVDEYPTILGVLASADLVLAYNAPFDVGCLRRTCELHGLAWVDLCHDCIMRWYARWFGEWSRGQYKWQKLTGGDHSALGDARAALALVKKMAGVEG